MTLQYNQNMFISVFNELGQNTMFYYYCLAGAVMSKISQLNTKKQPADYQPRQLLKQVSEGRQVIMLKI